MLRDPYPSNPFRPTRFAMTAVRLHPGEDITRTYSIGYTEAYAAKHWYEAMIYEGEADIRSAELEDIKAHHFTAEEEDWRLPDADRRLIARFFRGTWDQERPIPQAVEVTVEAKVRVKKEGIPVGYVTVGDIVKGSSLIPMKARAILRANRDKPSFGWAFAPAEVPNIRKLLGV